MSVDVPKVGSGKQNAEDWRSAMVAKAQSAASHLSTRERARNPMVPDNFLDFSGAGFPADLVVIPVQIPRQNVPAEMAQYREVLNRQWLHVPWSVISKNGGADGKANVPGASKYDLGGGEFVAVVAGNYLMYADKSQNKQRRQSNLDRATQNLQYKTQNSEDGRIRDFNEAGTMTVEELFEYEKQIGSEAPLEGIRVER